ncbi:adenine deaminase [Truepera radiovictrix]|uniref:Adenine deaminase n=1 Tax=Truepera radiovictrix (strain DSM 17093 / CIP 108686 / LMG 22925 / RQ-24) TaxID=649638 RepID=D7CQ33_TRURR|nr:adenine deaminase C-terminal domain-containing protein [Truepera radiovictrix]ADI14817.1 Adenine deaminase [Truepera radiovictrix DSM 17093]WMT56632.1 adenine deaminase C-terminal domain-containing protein [Truepera radiovictrix]
MGRALNRLSVPPLADLTRELAAVASGRVAPERVITGARLLSSYTERLLEDREVWFYRGRIAAVKPAGSARAALLDAPTYDAQGGILAPGLVDPHVHIESSMMTACAYAEAALLSGTTTVFCDSHEIANVCDLSGVEWMLGDARRAALNVFLTVPSTVPATSPAFETAGGDLTPEKIARVFDTWPEAAALGEKMDFVQVAQGDSRSHAILREALRRGKPVSGHVYGREFVAAYAASGITDTHEAIDGSIADDLLEAGMWLFLRGGPPTTPWHSLPEAIKTVTERGACAKRVCLCTDDRDADDLFLFGLDWVVREAVRAGLEPALAWSMGSLHAATRYALDSELGGLGHGRRADVVLLNDALEPQNTWYGGELVVEAGRVTPALDAALSARYTYPKAAFETVRLPAAYTLTPELPRVPCTANVIRTALPGITLFHERVELPVRASWAAHFDAEDLCFVSVLERHGRSGAVAHGLLKDFGLTSGAVASSVGHDAHNLIVAGREESDMRLAVETVRALRGGVVVVRDGQVLAQVALPIAGLLSEGRAPEVAAATAELKRAWRELGCTLPYMGFNLIPLSVIPELRITDQGLVTVPGMARLPLFEAAPGA